ncbi:hypothetical protein BJ742DRAFT_779846 [Cladochytrium replicatum]|nr:hypothetical protein BJ742DRAFT_779846 [Cladochytrium replicatum]
MADLGDILCGAARCFWALACLLCCPGPILIIVGGVLLGVATLNLRETAISRSQTAIDNWQNSGLSQFQSLNVFVQSSVQTPTFLDVVTTGDTIPDQSAPLSFSNYSRYRYATTVTSTSDDLAVKLHDRGLTNCKDRLECSKNCGTFCDTQCGGYGGTYTSYKVCTLYLYLQGICVRVAPTIGVNGSVTWGPDPDYSKEIGSGCYYDPKYESMGGESFPIGRYSQTYSSSTWKSVRFEVRSKLDPFIFMMAEMNLPPETLNFGVASSTLHSYGVPVLVSGVIIFLLYCLCCAALVRCILVRRRGAQQDQPMQWGGIVVPFTNNYGGVTPMVGAAPAMVQPIYSPPPGSPPPMTYGYEKPPEYTATQFAAPNSVVAQAPMVQQHPSTYQQQPQGYQPYYQYQPPHTPNPYAQQQYHPPPEQTPNSYMPQQAYQPPGQPQPGNTYMPPQQYQMPMPPNDWQ